MVEVEAPADAAEIDLDGVVDETTGIRYLGKATRNFDGCWVCLAAVDGALCVVEVTVRPAIHVEGDPGDEDDRGEHDRQLDRDLAQVRRRL